MVTPNSTQKICCEMKRGASWSRVCRGSGGGRWHSVPRCTTRTCACSPACPRSLSATLDFRIVHNVTVMSGKCICENIRKERNLLPVPGLAGCTNWFPPDSRLMTSQITHSDQHSKEREASSSFQPVSTLSNVNFLMV